MNSSPDVSPSPTTKRWQRLWQEPLTFIVLVWSLMLVLVGLCFAFTN
jgi:hypothetical protein